MKIAHFYHVYADGAFLKPLTEHLTALEESGLWDALDSMHVGVVGSRDNADRVLNFFNSVEIYAETGWEQVTLNALHEYAMHNDGVVFYAHTKGAWSQSELARQWRVSMTHDTVTRWRECYEALKEWDTAGAYWLRSSEPEHREHEFFYAGNFWWATTEYLRKLPPVKTENRFQAEGWIGLANPTAAVMRPGYSYWGNFWQPQS